MKITMNAQLCDNRNQNDVILMLCYHTNAHATQRRKVLESSSGFRKAHIQTFTYVHANKAVLGDKK